MAADGSRAGGFLSADGSDGAADGGAKARSGPSPLPWIAPFAVFMLLLVAEPWLADALEGVLDARWLYGVRNAVTLLLLVLFWRHYRELRDTPRTGAAGWAAGVAVGAGVFVLWILLDFPPLVTGPGDGGFGPRVDGAVHWGFALTRIAGAALVVPVMEELFWRSFVMRWIERPRFLDVDPATVGLKGVLVSSAIFASEHRLWFAGLLAGLAYAELYRRTGDLRVAVVAHALTNALLGIWVLGTGSWGFW